MTNADIYSWLGVAQESGALISTRLAFRNCKIVVLQRNNNNWSRPVDSLLITPLSSADYPQHDGLHVLPTLYNNANVKMHLCDEPRGSA